MHRKTRLSLTDLNPLLTCSLCKGYLIDATTLTECLHSFCRSCLVRYLHTSQNCPKCNTLVHKTRPLHNASSSRLARSPGNLGVDRALQNIVYKLVPGLFRDEMKKRRDFYTQHPQAAGTSTSSSSPGDLEDRGEVGEEALVIYSDDEHMNLSLEYYLPYKRKLSDKSHTVEKEPTNKRANGDLGENDNIVDTRYLRCPAAVCVKHIKKFIRNKFDLKHSYQIEITHVDNEDDSLPDDYTLMDVAYIYTWRRNGPLPLVFRVFQAVNKRQKTVHVIDDVLIPEAVPEAVPDNSSKELLPQHPSITQTPVSLTTIQEHSGLVQIKPPSLERKVIGPKEQSSDSKSVRGTTVTGTTVTVSLGNVVTVEKTCGIEPKQVRKHVENGESNHKKDCDHEVLAIKLESAMTNNNEKPELVKENGEKPKESSSIGNRNEETLMLTKDPAQLKSDVVTDIRMIS